MNTYKVLVLSLKKDIEVNNNSARAEHEATTSKVDEDQLFYCMQRGIGEEDAVALIVNGFCKEVLQALPFSPFHD